MALTVVDTCLPDVINEEMWLEENGELDEPLMSPSPALLIDFISQLNDAT